MKWVDLKESEKLLGEGIELTPFKVRLAQSDKDRDEVFRIRYQIFNEELGEGIPESALTKRDVDQFDMLCDHLVIERDGKIVGTYRLFPGTAANRQYGFYSETEFYIRNLPIDFNSALEMSRACILPEFRKQGTLICLFCGIRHYMNLKNCHFLFGMASLPMMSHEDALATYQEIRKMGRALSIPGVTPIPKMQIPTETVAGANPQIPPLLSVYFEFGAYICAAPSYDPVFRCHDVLTLMRLEEVPERTWNLLGRFARRQARGESSA